MGFEIERRTRAAEVDLVSTDVFDTVLLRDHTLEVQRLSAGARLGARRLGVDPGVVEQLRWNLHRTAYLAVAMEHPEGEARLTAMTAAMARILGLPPTAAEVLAAAEIEVDARHLRPNRPLLAALTAAAGRGTRVIAVSDTWYSEGDLRRLFAAVVGEVPFAAVYSSADEGVTKHTGGLYRRVAGREAVDPARVLHLGDNAAVDVRRAREAGWNAVHVAGDPRRERLQKFGGIVGVAKAWRRAW